MKRVCKKTNFYQVESKERKKRKKRSDENLRSSVTRIVPRENLLVWGRCRGFGMWPGRIANRSELKGPVDPLDDPTRWINWYGDHKFTETRVDQMAYFHDFSYFKENIYHRSTLYQKAVDEALEEAAVRSNHKIRSKIAAIEWAKNNFSPQGYLKLLPDTIDLCCTDYSFGCNKTNMDLSMASNCSKESNTSMDKYDYEQKNISFRFLQVNLNHWNVNQICFGCGSSEVTCHHPLFHGGLCELCQVDYRESAYLLDQQGYYMYCSVCGGGKNVITCDNINCGRCFCQTCMDTIVDAKAFVQASSKIKWICYLCEAKENHGNLTRREGWREELIKFMNGDKTTLTSEILPLPSCASQMDRRKCKVLSLFDGIATGFLALKELQIDVECYYASEIDHDSVSVAETRHLDKICHIGDVLHIDDATLKKLGPFDLVIGGSPCNDLSIVNPARKGIWSDKGSGCLFFEYVRILRSCQLLSAVQGRCLFWVFENVVCMDKDSKDTISRFLQCNPVCLDANVVSPAHRPRYYWGNLPGMNRPMVASAIHKLTVQDCLEPGRTATTEKLRTITTRVGSVRQCGGNDLVQANALVVKQRKEKDSLWITEIERIFGFPDHYTDVSNMSRSSRMKVLGKSWSVPVIKHLFAPLKDYFASSE